MSTKIKNITSFIRSRLDVNTSGGASGSVDWHEPQVGLVLGSGLGGLISAMEVHARLPYAEIPDFPQVGVVGHAGEFVYGRLGGVWVLAMSGRIHYYQGYDISEVVLPIRVMCLLGIRALVVSNAAGGLNPKFKVGDVMVIEDQINLLPNPLVGANDDEWGERFPDMSEAYSRRWVKAAFEVASAFSSGSSSKPNHCFSSSSASCDTLSLQRGVYVGSSGPSYETPAEYRYLRTIGADATGMSTTPEVIVARHHGVEVFGLSLISNVAPVIADGGVTAITAVTAVTAVTSHSDVFAAAAAAADKMARLVEKVIAMVYKSEQ